MSKKAKPDQNVFVDPADFDGDIPFVPGSSRTAMKELGAKSQDLWFAHPDDIKVFEHFNPRTDTPTHLAYIRWLADQMKIHGFKRDFPLSVVAVRNEDGSSSPFVTNGHTRLRAVKIARSEGAQIESIPLIYVEQGTSMEDLTIALSLSNSGQPLTMYETAVTYKRLITFGRTPEDIAKVMGRSLVYVEGLLMLIAAHRDIRAMVQQDQISATLAIDTLRKHGVKALDVLKNALEEAKAKGASKATAKNVQAAPAQQRRKVLHKAAPKLYDTLGEITKDPEFKSISPQLQAKIEDLLLDLRESGADLPVEEEQPNSKNLELDLHDNEETE
ncbi:ParB/RepB/Spo0J family partition protein [Diaphorobacter caeni]|uniref:ParB/RepB/Spo0J family partition protein n=1 Tax=Diaphorobacter caeni TaxID=2784387 RepID=UPI00188E9091|nr:hypothetical protein [Diaphorobacter caeni]MBF5007854.1 hypothetical protein [Diaphorobacter caeni]